MNYQNNNGTEQSETPSLEGDKRRTLSVAEQRQLGNTTKSAQRASLFLAKAEEVDITNHKKVTFLLNTVDEFEDCGDPEAEMMRKELLCDPFTLETRFFTTKEKETLNK